MTPTQLSQFTCALKRLCDRFGVAVDQIESPCRFAAGENRGKTRVGRRADLVLIRQILMVYGRSLGISSVQIGLLLDRCPSDITHGCRTFQNRHDTEKHVRELWDWLQTPE